jgi:1-acyl-sn-glycerol-3-phosphate acyltransferase
MLVFLLLGVGALALTLPFAALGRRRVVRTAARAFLAFPGLKLKVSGLEHLPERGSIVVANHSSYLDGPILYAALPARYAFVIKKEMARVPLVSLLLNRLGSQYVERRNRHKGASDARRVARLASSGESLVFFPEGSFTERVGLWRFHAGAFVTAARAGVPVVPVAIRGAREVLHPLEWLLRPGTIEVEILPPVGAGAPLAAVELKRAARAAILARLGEPDLEAEGHAPLG